MSSLYETIKILVVCYFLRVSNTENVGVFLGRLRGPYPDQVLNFISYAISPRKKPRIVVTAQHQWFSLIMCIV